MKITPQHIESVIDYVNYKTDGLLTICIVTLRNGYKILGKSACDDPDIYNYQKGMGIAREDAVRQVWPLEGYLLKERLYEEDLEKCREEDAMDEEKQVHYEIQEEESRQEILDEEENEIRQDIVEEENRREAMDGDD